MNIEKCMILRSQLSMARTATEAVRIGKLLGMSAREALEKTRERRLDHTHLPPLHKRHGAEWAYQLPCWAAEIVRTDDEFSLAVFTHCTWQRCNGDERKPWCEPPTLHPRLELHRGGVAAYCVSVATFDFCPCGLCSLLNFKLSSWVSRQEACSLVSPFLPLLNPGEREVLELEGIVPDSPGSNSSERGVSEKIIRSLVERISNGLEGWKRISL